MVSVIAIASTFVGSNPVQIHGFLRELKTAARLPSEGK
jgi:hypothetical protein